MTIDGTTLVCASIGSPNRQSKAPAMHNAGFRALGLNFAYVAFSPEPDRLPEAVAGLRALGFRGFSVTKPFKETIVPLLDSLDRTAAEIGAVNTVLNDGGRLVGYNSDWIGAVRAVEETLGRSAGAASPEPAPGSLAGLRVCVVGAGGAGKAVAWGFRRAGCEVVLFNRGVERAANLARVLGVECGGAPEGIAAAGSFDALVNATSVGMGSSGDESAVPEEALRRGMAVLDAVISPRNTALLRAARRRGCRAVPGARMLLYQGLFQFALFTGAVPPGETMRAALDRALR